MKTYIVNEIFHSLQGEGVRAGTPNVFVRFAGCNLECQAAPGDKSPGGFDCDTEFTSGRKLLAAEILDEVLDLMPTSPAVILTGGEPLLQVDQALLEVLKLSGVYVAVETNGSIAVPAPNLVDWICVSPKIAEHAIQQGFANEVKYVRHVGQEIPKTRVQATYKIVSPAWATGEGFGKNLAWCIDLVKRNPEWRLSIQQHKIWRVR